MDASAGALGVDEVVLEGSALVEGAGSAAVLQPLRMSAVARPRTMTRDFKLVPSELVWIPTLPISTTSQLEQ